MYAQLWRGHYYDDNFTEEFLWAVVNESQLYAGDSRFALIPTDEFGNSLNKALTDLKA